MVELLNGGDPEMKRGPSISNDYMNSFKNKNSRLESVNDTDSSMSAVVYKALPDFDTISASNLNDP